MVTTYSQRKKRTRILQYFILCVISLIIVVPMVTVVFGALKTRGEFMMRPYSLPVPPHWENTTLILGQTLLLADAA